MTAVITLTTDFGERDPFVGIMKGVVLGIAPDARIVDLTHEVAPQAVREAAFALQGSWHFFPRGTVHLVVVDPGVGSERAIVCARRSGHLFLAPDNGVLTSALEEGSAEEGPAEVRRLEASRFALPRVSNTFHGRDIFAPAAANLARGFPFEETGPLFPDWFRFPLPRATKAPDGTLTGEVVVVDRFGNLITNVSASDVADLGVDAVVTVGGNTIRGLSRSYRDAPPGRAAALVDSFDRLEVALPMGNAAEALGVGVGDPVEVRPA